MNRDAFLARLRSTARAPASLPHPMREIDGTPAIHYRHALDDLPSAFRDKAAGAGMTVRDIAGPDDLDAFLVEVVTQHDVRTAVVSGDPEAAGVPERLRSAGVEVVAFDPSGAMREADLGVTGAALGVAATGSVVVDASRAGGRSASLLPPLHLALLRAENIVADARAAFARMAGDLPSQFSFITGPSRSADIELTLTTGVHGPKHVWVGLLF
jgi:L-lactate utilization protein LutC